MATEPAGPKLNVGCGQDIRPKSDGWTNMDFLPLSGVDAVHDMMEFPWPFPNDSFAYVYASHVLEHVPHYVPGKKRDGFLLWMEELHRVLRPDGIFQCKVPYYRHDGYWSDPTHTRTIHPSVFTYFEPQGFYTPARFETLSIEKLPFQGFSILSGRINQHHLKKTLGIKSWPFPFFRGTNELRITLRKKPREPGWKGPE